MNDKIKDGFWWKADLCQVFGSNRDSKNNNGDGDASSKHVQSHTRVDTYTI